MHDSSVGRQRLILCELQTLIFEMELSKGALLVVDSSLSPCDGSLLVCAIEGEFRIKRYRLHPKPHLINLDNGRREELPIDVDDGGSVFGVITYIINDAQSGEFDDCPVM